MSKFVMGSDDDTKARLIKLRSTCSTKYLEDVQDTNIHKGSMFGIVDLSSLDDDSMSWQIDSLSIPAWCMANPALNSSFSCLFLDFSIALLAGPY